MGKMIYLDNAATTKTAPEVVQAMLPYFSEYYGNPSSIYDFAGKSKEAITKGREQIAEVLGAKKEEIYFTAGGSESDNWALKATFEAYKAKGNHIITTKIEHHAILHTCEYLEKHGYEVTYLDVDENGVVRLDELEKAITPETILISVMFANNEIGTIQPIKEIGRIAKEHGILFHTDCVQAAGCHPIDVEKIGCDFLSISSHKIHGPKGVGALFAKEKSMLASIIFGGAEQEFGLRGGTENVACIVGFGMACEISTKSLHEDCIWVSTLKQRFYMALTDALKKNGCAEIVHTNGSSVLSPGKTLNLCLRGIDGQTLLLMLDGKSICISAGSACRSHEAEPSHVLIAMGLTPDEARSSIRISFSRMNTADEIVDAANIIASCIEILASGVEK